MAFQKTRYCYYCGVVPSGEPSVCPASKDGKHCLHTMTEPMYCYYCSVQPGNATRCPTGPDGKHCFHKV